MIAAATSSRIGYDSARISACPVRNWIVRLVRMRSLRMISTVLRGFLASSNGALAREEAGGGNAQAVGARRKIGLALAGGQRHLGGLGSLDRDLRLDGTARSLHVQLELAAGVDLGEQDLRGRFLADLDGDREG